MFAMNCCWRWRLPNLSRTKCWSTSIEITRMSTSAELMRSPLDAIAPDRRLYYFRTQLKNYEIDVATKAELFVQLREWLDELTDDVILGSHQRQYNPVYLNLLSVFGEKLTNEEVHSIAIKCIKTKFWNELEYHFYLSQVLDVVKRGRAADDQSL